MARWSAADGCSQSGGVVEVGSLTTWKLGRKARPEKFGNANPYGDQSNYYATQQWGYYV
jgi:hypothetical protein